MKIKKIRLSSLKANDTYSLSFPVRPEIFKSFALQFPGFPAIIMNPYRVIIFGIDAYHFLKSQGEKETMVFETGISLKDGLFLNYNLKEKLFGLNPFEKLCFLKKTIPISSLSEIHHRTRLDIPVTKELIDNLESLTGEDLKTLLIKDRVNLKSALRILNLTGSDRITVIQLFDRIPFSSSHQQALLDMLEEMIFRDKSTIKNILNRADINRFLKMEMPQKEILKTIFTMRFPAYSKTKKNWEKWVKTLKLSKQIQIKHADFFEKKQLQLTLFFNDQKDLENTIRKIKK